jgi:hypothetical protein
VGKLAVSVTILLPLLGATALAAALEPSRDVERPPHAPSAKGTRTDLGHAMSDVVRTTLRRARLVRR